jgi:hypothetical protein
VALGPTTASRLHVAPGDHVTVGTGSSARRALVVGIVTFPTIGVIHAAHTSLGVGALVLPKVVPGYDRDITGTFVGDFGPRTIFVRYRPGTDAAAELRHLRTTTLPLAGFAGLDVLPVQRPAEIVNSGSVGNAPVLLAAALALGAVVSLALAVGSSVRYRYRDLAVLKTLGFTRRQLSATDAWQATTTVLVGLVVGVPLGLVAGPALWRLFARQLDVVAQPAVPALGIVAVVGAALVVANLASALPALGARRVDPSRLFRTE